MQSRLFKAALTLFLCLAAGGAAWFLLQGPEGLVRLGNRDLKPGELRPEGYQDAGLTDRTGMKPRLAQKTSFASTVYLEHSSCGSDCWTYDIAEDQAALNLAARVSFDCPQGDIVEELRVTFPDGRAQVIYDADNGLVRRRFEKTVVLEPWTPDQIRERAGQALGGDWQGPRLGQGGNVQSANITLRQAVLVEGRCQLDPTPRSESFQVDSLLSVIDTAWTLPAR